MEHSPPPARGARRRHRIAALSFVLLLARAARPQDAPPQQVPEQVFATQGPGSVVSETGIATASNRFRLRGEIKVNGRSSTAESITFRPAGVPVPISMDTVSPHGSIEVSNVALIGEADFTPHISAKAEIHFLDLYNRNPTSSDDRVFVREAWIRFGKKYESLAPAPGTSFYLQAGKAPRFTKQLGRRLESYGLWGTAFGRFEEIGVEAGGSFGKVVYWRGVVANGSPLFFRDPNALAGDNGTPERTTFDGEPIYGSGFPILYDAKVNDVSLNGQLLAGGGLGFRILGGPDERNGVDVLGFYFHRKLADHVAIRGSFYSGDIDLLDGLGVVSLPLTSDTKEDYGVNLDARFGRLQLFGQYVHQDIGGLVRDGYEAEIAFRFPLNGLFVSGDSPVLNWVQPCFRYSIIDNRFSNPPGFVAPSMSWDWTKYDFGFRLGIVRGVDLTVEYARNDVTTRNGLIHPDEFLTTLRAGF